MRNMDVEVTVVDSIRAVIEDLSSEIHVELATELVNSLEGVEPVQQLDTLRLLINDMIRDLDVVEQEDDES